jgi:hypothetical protein
VINVETGAELFAVTKRIYKIPEVHFEFWTGTVGMIHRQRWNLSEPIPQDPLTLYVKIIARNRVTVPVETDQDA